MFSRRSAQSHDCLCLAECDYHASGLVVWQRFEVLLLKSFCADIRQVAYYSIAFSLGDALLLSSTIFGSAVATTMYAQFRRVGLKTPQLASTTVRYLTLTSMPLHAVATALAFPALISLLWRQVQRSCHRGHDHAIALTQGISRPNLRACCRARSARPM